MAKGKKYHYYVLVYTSNGPVYVTSVNNMTKVAHWNKEEKTHGNDQRKCS